LRGWKSRCPNRRRPHPGAPNQPPLVVGGSGVVCARRLLGRTLPTQWAAARAALARGSTFSDFDIFCWKFVENLGKNRTSVLFLEFQNPRKTPREKIFLNYFQISIDFLTILWYNIVKKNRDLGKDLGFQRSEVGVPIYEYYSRKAAHCQVDGEKNSKSVCGEQNDRRWIRKERVSYAGLRNHFITKDLPRLRQILHIIGESLPRSDVPNLLLAVITKEIRRDVCSMSNLPRYRIV
jgi:hypothetical protein